MTVYSIALFIHIVSAVGLFVAFGLEWTGLRQLHLPLVAGANRIAIPSMIVAVLSGFSLARASWHRLAWIEVAVGTVVAIIAIGVTITRPRLRAGLRTIDPMLIVSVRVRTALTVGIVFLMTVKPAMRESLLAIAAAGILGVVAAVPVRSRA